VTQSPKNRTVLFDHDGGVDDLLSLMMLLSMPHLDLAGVVVTPADCFLRPATSATLKILRFFERTDVKVSQGALHGVNSFPRAWRAHAYAIDALPILNESVSPLPEPVAEAGHEFLAHQLRQADTAVTVLLTGPVSNLAAALSAEPDLVSKIEEVVWMGGALDVAGNVRDYEHDGSAEWNAYWDPPSTYKLWQVNNDLPLTVFPLDVTDHVRVTPEFLLRLARQRKYPLSDLAGQCWALTVGVIPAYEYIYHMWDTLTTGYLGAPASLSFRQVRTEVIPTGPSAGRIKAVETGGRLIKAAAKVEIERFLEYVLELFRR
jgi:purine nucleosidase